MLIRKCLILLVVSLFPFYGFAEILEEGPSINLVTPTSITIVWKTVNPSIGSIELTNESGKSLSVIKETSKTPAKEHQVKLPNLDPDKGYGYQVITKSTDFLYKSEWIPFTSGITQNTPFRFVSLSDSRGRQNGVNVDILSKIASKVSETKSNLMIFQGDLIGGYVDETIGRIQYAQWKQVMNPYWKSAPIYPGIGNHDAGVKVNGVVDGAKLFDREFLNPQNGPDSYKGTVYSFDFGNSHFVSLNSNDLTHKSIYNNQINQEQLSWFENDLASTKQLHKFVFLHDPAYPCGAHIGDSLDKFPEQRDKFLSICDKYGVEIIFCGHEHNYDRRNLDSTINPILHNTIYQVKNGTCGASIYKVNKDTKNQMVYKEVFHYVLVDVEGPKVTLNAFDINGNIIDQFSYSK